MNDADFRIDAALIDNQAAIDARIAELAETERETAILVLRYLYMTDGPRSIPRDKKSQAEECLTPVEVFVFQWLFKRTDGKLRRIYGAGVLDAVKRSRYQCECCGFADVRALNLEKREQGDKVSFACLCANCNTVESRAKEMAKIDISKRQGAEAAAAAIVSHADGEPAVES